MVSTRSQSTEITVHIPRDITTPNEVLRWVRQNLGETAARISWDYIRNIDWQQATNEAIQQVEDALHYVYNTVMAEPDRERVRLEIESAQQNQGRLGQLDTTEADRNPGHQGIQPLEGTVSNNGNTAITSKSLFNLHKDEHI